MIKHKEGKNQNYLEILIHIMPEHLQIFDCILFQYLKAAGHSYILCSSELNFIESEAIKART